MNEQQKKGLFAALLEMIKAIFTIGKRHVDKHLDNGEAK